jgi:hypothetical protein
MGLLGPVVPPYSGTLLEPMPGSGLLGLSPLASAEAKARKLAALFAHFRIPENEPDAWQRLAMALAEQHVPAFQSSWMHTPAFQDAMNGKFHESLFLNPWVAPKRGRGRPKKVRGLLQMAPAKKPRQKPGPKAMSDDDRAQIAAILEATKERFKLPSFQAAAMHWLEELIGSERNKISKQAAAKRAVIARNTYYRAQRKAKADSD